MIICKNDYQRELLRAQESKRARNSEILVGDEEGSWWNQLSYGTEMKLMAERSEMMRRLMICKPAVKLPEMIAKEMEGDDEDA